MKHVRALAVDAAGLGPWEVTSGTLEAYLRRQSWSRQTRAKVLVSLRAFYAWAMDQGLCSRSPLAGVTVDHRKPGPVPASPRVLAWAQAIADHLVWLRAGGRCSGTINVHRCHLFALAELYADPWQVTGDDLALWLARSDVAPETRRSMRSSAASFYRWAVESERLEVNPARYLQPVKGRPYCWGVPAGGVDAAHAAPPLRLPGVRDDAGPAGGAGAAGAREAGDDSPLRVRAGRSSSGRGDGGWRVRAACSALVMPLPCAVSGTGWRHD